MSGPSAEHDLDREIKEATLAGLRAVKERAKRDDERKEEEHRLKVAAMTGRGPYHEEPKGETTTPIIIEVSNLLPGVPRAQFLAVFKGKFEPHSLHKLRALHANDEPNTQQVTLSESGNFQIQQAKAKLKDYGSIHAIWLEGLPQLHTGHVLLFRKTYTFAYSRPHELPRQDHQIRRDVSMERSTPSGPSHTTPTSSPQAR